MNEQTGLELLNNLYFLRESARQVLHGEDTERRNLCLCFGQLADALHYNGETEEKLKAAFDDVMPDILREIAASKPDMERLEAVKLAQNEEACTLFGEEACQAFSEAQASLVEAKKKYQKAVGKKSVSRGSKSVNEDTLQVQALKEEIRRWIKTTNKLDSDKARGDALKQLEATERLNVSAKDGIISVSFGSSGIPAVFSVSTKALTRGTGISKFGGLQDVLGTEEAKKFAEVLAKHKKGKEYLTAKGQSLTNKEKTEKSAAQKKTENIKMQKEALRQVGIEEKKLAEQWQKMICGAEPVLAWKRLVKPKIEKGDTKLIEQMTQKVLDAEALWGVYKPKEEKNDNRSFYDSLAGYLVNTTEIRGAVEEGYRQFEKGCKKETAVSMMFSKVNLSTLQGMPKEIVEQAVLDEAFQFGMNVYGNGNTPWDDKKIEFMNEVLATRHINIGFEEKKITEKCSVQRLNDIIHEKDGAVKVYKKKMTALLYDMGRVIGNADPRAKMADISVNPDFRKRFVELDAGSWDVFSHNSDNLKKAVETKALLEAEFGGKTEETVRAMREGAAVKDDSLHHIVYAYYAPLMGNNSEVLIDKFNSRANTVEVFCGHPARVDMHKDVEHRYNVSSGGSVLVESNGKKMYKTVKTAQVDDVLLMPVVKVRENAKQPFRPLMNRGMLFMTSGGKSIDDPLGSDGGKTLFTQNNQER